MRKIQFRHITILVVLALTSALTLFYLDVTRQQPNRDCVIKDYEFKVVSTDSEGLTELPGSLIYHFYPRTALEFEYPPSFFMVVSVDGVRHSLNHSDEILSGSELPHIYSEEEPLIIRQNLSLGVTDVQPGGLVVRNVRLAELQRAIGRELKFIPYLTYERGGYCTHASPAPLAAQPFILRANNFSF